MKLVSTIIFSVLFLAQGAQAKGGGSYPGCYLAQNFPTPTVVEITPENSFMTVTAANPEPLVTGFLFWRKKVSYGNICRIRMGGNISLVKSENGKVLLRYQAARQGLVDRECPTGTLLLESEGWLRELECKRQIDDRKLKNEQDRREQVKRLLAQ